MNNEIIVKELNAVLLDHVASRLFSSRGKRMIFPLGIVAQTEESAYATIKATAGIAMAQGQPITLPCISSLLPHFNTRESVAYAPVAGLGTLRDAWQNHILKRNKSLAKENITKPIVTSGITHGIRVLLDLMLEEDEELISPDMFWENYEHIASTACGGSVRTFRMFSNFENERGLNIAGLKDVMNQSAEKQGKIILLLNFPNNPTGYSLTKTDIARLQDLMYSFAEKNIPVLIMCDDAYFGLFYEDNIFCESSFSVFSKLHENILAVKLDGATKELFSWGLRVGFITLGNKTMSDAVKKALETKIKGALRASTTSASQLSQSIVLRTVEHPTIDSQMEKQFLDMKNRYIITKQAITEASSEYPHSSLVPYPCNSGYFISFHSTKISAETIRQYLLARENESIALISLGATLRFTFAAVDAEKIQKIIDTLYKETQKLMLNAHNA